MDRIHNKYIVDLAKELRKNMTNEERHLWYDFCKPFCQTYQYRFTKQKIIGGYIVDFYCPKAKLVVELDGSQHYEKEAELYDKQRTEYLNQHGIEVQRYSNRDIHTRFTEVCQDIKDHVLDRIKELGE